MVFFALKQQPTGSIVVSPCLTSESELVNTRNILLEHL